MGVLKTALLMQLQVGLTLGTQRLEQDCQRVQLPGMLGSATATGGSPSATSGQIEWKE